MIVSPEETINRFESIDADKDVELSFASHSIKANEVRVNNTTQFSSGIVLPK